MCKKKHAMEPRPDHLFNCRSDASLQEVLHSDTGEICENKFAAAPDVMCKTSDCGKYPKAVAQPQPVASTAAPAAAGGGPAKKEPEPKKR